MSGASARCGCAVLVSAALLAAAPAISPRDAVMQSLERARVVALSEDERNAKLEALHAIADELLDGETMGRRAIGSALEAQRPDQQAEFLGLFGRLIVRAYLQKLLFFRKPEFAFVRETRRGDEPVIHTEIRTRRDSYSVEYELQRRGDSWVATDVEVEGVSLVGNYRDQLASLLRERSFDELLELIRRKVDRYGGRGTP